MASESDYRSETVSGWAQFDVPVSGHDKRQLRQSSIVVEPATQPLNVPPLFAQQPDWIQPISLQGAPAADAFALPDVLNATVSSARPLRVELTPPGDAVQDAFAVVPVVSDGEFVYLAGPPARVQGTAGLRGPGQSVQISVTKLPSATAAPSTNDAEQRIGVWRAIKLGFFKLVGIPTSETGLRVPSLQGDKVVYRAVTQNELRNGRIALLTHGFLSETNWMVRELLGEFQQHGYDHIVTWDYETFTSPVRQTMSELIAKLDTAGVRRNSARLEIVAHSMGSLVARSLLAADKPSLGLVRRGILLGPPNAGTPIAGVADRITDVASLLINVSYGPISLRSLVRFLWEFVDQGMDDLQPESELFNWLNRNLNQQTAPITVVAGDAAQGDQMQTLIARILNQSAQAFYGGKNDLVVPVESMKRIEGVNVGIEPATCNHFDYLKPGEGSRKVIEDWIRSPGD